MKIKTFLDGANLEEILQHKDFDQISGFTTNPSLMRKAGVKDYMEFAHNLAKKIPSKKHVSVEVIADDLEEMQRQAIIISSVSENVFAGRIADTGVNPASIMANCKGMLRLNPVSELLWASCRETYSIYQADSLGCDIITAPSGILKKLSLKNKDLEKYSLETVQGFYSDAQAANYVL